MVRKIDLDKLSKDDLIRVIANMHDVIQEWDNGWGLPSSCADALISVGNACTKRCVDSNNWDVDNI